MVVILLRNSMIVFEIRKRKFETYIKKVRKKPRHHRHCCIIFGQCEKFSLVVIFRVRLVCGSWRYFWSFCAKFPVSQFGNSSLQFLKRKLMKRQSNNRKCSCCIFLHNLGPSGPSLEIDSTNRGCEERCKKQIYAHHFHFPFPLFLLMLLDMFNIFSFFLRKALKILFTIYFWKISFFHTTLCVLSFFCLKAFAVRWSNKFFTVSISLPPAEHVQCHVE